MIALLLAWVTLAVGGYGAGTLATTWYRPGTFAVFRISILRGRAFTDVESDAGTPVAVVSESAAHRLWPGREAIGQTVSIPRVDHKGPSFERAPDFTEARVIGVAISYRSRR